MKNLFILFAIFTALVFPTFAQKHSNKKRPSYNPKLAKKVGADDYGMKNYVLCILRTGAKDAEITDKKQRQEIFAGHMANIDRLAKEGKIVLAGPFGENDRDYRGIFIFNVTTIDEAQKLVETDPVIRSGIMIAELTPWYGSAALMLVNGLHTKVSKKNF